MNELKAGVIVTPHDEGMCFDRGSDVMAVTERETEFYLKSEADKVMAHNKFKRCLGIAAVCFEKSYSTTLVKYDKESGLLRNFYDWWGKYWLKLAEKFKPNKSTAQ